MTIPADCVRVNINWVLPEAEIAVNTLNFQHRHSAGNTLDWEGDMTQRYANLVMDGLAANWNAMKAMFSSSVSIGQVAAYHLDTTGHALDKKVASPPAGGLAGSATGGMLPLEVSLAVSLLGYDPAAFVPLSARKRGRIYLPGLAQSLCQPGGRVNNVSGTVVTPLAGFFNYVNGRFMDANGALAPSDRERADLVILSKTGGITTRVRSFYVDNLFDVQRRRQNALVPARTANALTGPATGSGIPV